MQHLDIFGGGMNRPKGSDNESEYDDDELVRKNTRMNAITGAALPGKIYDSEPESGDDSDVDSKTNDSSDTDDASTVVDSDTNTDASGESDVNFDEMEDVEDTPAMIAKKTATAASALANSDAAKKKPNKRVVKGKATLEDITTLQQSYDDVELNDDTGDANDLDGDDDEDSDDGTNYLRKFDSEMRENYITSHHHEMMQLNTAEVDALVRVVRNADGVIVDSLHKTMPFLTKYEKTRILGQRAKQLNQGAQPVVPVDKKIIDGYLIAQLELQQKALPFIIRRPLPGGKSEYWRLADLELI
jgi:DNA-directed RNA polymerase I, II, and III subunit RPABC2